MDEALLKDGGVSHSRNNQKSNNGSFRGKLQNQTGKSGQGYQAHHIFPRKFSDQFRSIGIDNELPKYGAWWETSAHQHNSYKYNLWWAEFFETEGVTKETAETLAKLLAALFGYDLNF